MEKVKNFEDIEVEKVKVVKEYVRYDTVDLSYEDRCLVRMNALSKAMNLKENGKIARAKYKKMSKRKKIIFIVSAVVVILAVSFYIWMFLHTKNKRHVFYLWLLIVVIALLVFSSMI